MGKDRLDEMQDEAFLDDPEAVDADDEEITDAAIEAEEVAALKAENGELKDRLLRALADVENIRKRGERDRRDAELYAATRFARDGKGGGGVLKATTWSISSRMPICSPMAWL